MFQSRAPNVASPSDLAVCKNAALVAGFSSQPQAKNTAVPRSRCLFLRASLYCRICINFTVGMKFQMKTHGFINDQLPDLNNLRWASLVFKSSVLLLPAHGTPSGQGGCFLWRLSHLHLWATRLGIFLPTFAFYPVVLWWGYTLRSEFLKQ